MYQAHEDLSKAAECTLVCGPPGAGKTTYVQQHRRRGDIVIDFDYLFHAISFEKIHDKPETLLRYVLELRADALARLALLGADRPRSWIIATAPRRSQRIEYRAQLPGLKTVLIQAPMSDCIARIAERDISPAEKKRVVDAIQGWFQEFEPDTDEAERSISI